MPSPFPGMDPYLEHPAGWMGFHNALVVEMMAALNQQLMPAYYADSEERVYISTEGDPGRKAIVPDIKVIRTGKKAKPVGAAAARKSSAGVAVCEPIDVTTLIDVEIHEPYLTVIHRESGRVVTVIEVVSPANKVAGATGRESYLGKRTAAQQAGINWVEIDLLRDGVPLFFRDVYPPSDYYVFMSKLTGRSRSLLWPIRIQERLPEILIPLGGNDPDAKLDLQPLLDTVYDRGPYSVKLKYKADPPPPLPPELAKWADALLRKKKLR
jgi:hypothetical protein